MNALTPVGSNALVPHDMDQAIRLAKAMASAKLVPEHLHNDVGSCLMIVEQAMRWKMSPFAVAQCTSVIHKRLMFEGKLVAAAVECSGAINGGFDYKFAGEGEDRTITVSAIRAGEQQRRDITARLGDVKTNNEIWKKQPDQQLVYAGTRIWARRWTPAVMLGVYAPEEFDRQTGSIVTEEVTTIEHEPDAPSPAPSDRDKINAEVPISPKATVSYPSPESTEKKREINRRKRQWENWLVTAADSLSKATTEEEVHAILARDSVAKAVSTLDEGSKDPDQEMANFFLDIKDRFDELVQRALDRVADAQSAAEPPLSDEDAERTDQEIARFGA